MAEGVKVTITAVDKFSKTFTKGSKSLKTFGLAAGGLITMLGVQGVRSAAAFEQSMANVATLMDGDSSAAIERMSSGIKDLLLSVPKSADDLGASAYDIVSSGISDTGDALVVLESSAKLATAGLGTTKEATDLMTSAINAFGLSAGESEQVADIFFKTVKGGKTTISELSQAFGAVAPVAKSQGVSLVELSAATAAVTTTGLKAAQVQNGLKAVLSNMIKPTAELEQVFAALGVRTGKDLIEASGGLVPALQAVQEAGAAQGKELGVLLGSVEGLTVAESLLGAQSQLYAELANGMVDGSNKLTGAFEKQTDATMNQWQMMENNLNVTLMDLGETILPTVNKALTEMNDTMREQREITGQSQDVLSTLEPAYNEVSGAAKNATGVQKEYFDKVAKAMKVQVNAQKALEEGWNNYGAELLDIYREQLVGLNEWTDTNKSELLIAGVDWQNFSEGTRTELGLVDGRFAGFIKNHQSGMGAYQLENARALGESGLSFSDFSTSAKGSFDDITDKATGTATNAAVWGKHLSDNLAAGITEGIPAVSDAVNANMFVIRRLAHSKNKELPEEEWGKHSMENFAEGIDEGKEDVEVSVGGIIDVLNNFSTEQEKSFDKGIDGVRKLQREYAKSIGDVQSKVQELTAGLAGIFDEFAGKEQESRNRLADAIIDSEEEIMDLKEDALDKEKEIARKKEELLNEENEDKRKQMQDRLLEEALELEEIEARLVKEIEVRTANNELIKQLDNEVTEAKRKNGLTQLESAIEVFAKEREENQEWLKERLAAFQAELSEAERVMPELEKLYNDRTALVTSLLEDEKLSSEEVNLALEDTKQALIDTIRLFDTAYNAKVKLLGEQGFSGIGVNFASGGIAGSKVVGSGSGDRISALLSPGELVLNKAQQKNLAGSLSGGAGSVLNVYVSGNTLLDDNAGLILGDQIMRKLKHNIKL